MSASDLAKQYMAGEQRHSQNLQRELMAINWRPDTRSFVAFFVFTKLDNTKRDQIRDMIASLVTSSKSVLGDMSFTFAPGKRNIVQSPHPRNEEFMQTVVEQFKNIYGAVATALEINRADFEVVIRTGPVVEDERDPSS